MRLEARVQRVVEEGCPFDGVQIVTRYEGEAMGDGEEACGLWDGGESLLKVSAVHDARERAQRGVVRTMFIYQRLEGAAASLVFVWIRAPPPPVRRS